jgi:hypothetical protein
MTGPPFYSTALSEELNTRKTLEKGKASALLHPIHKDIPKLEGMAYTLRNIIPA